MSELKRTHTIEEIIAADMGTEATLMGWVSGRRDLGQLIFVTLRDRWAELQCAVDPTESHVAITAASKLRREFVVAFTGYTRPRPDKERRDYAGGDREFVVQDVQIIARAETPPLVVEEELKAGEEMRLRYRYLDLRRRAMVRNLTLRHKAVAAIRAHLNGKGFLEVETPLLARSTPEGARDYVVPSRVHPGSFYALPQSPQLFKQILMCSGIDRYYQIARCLRDEDLRGNRQPEHTQLDLEMSFATRDELFELVEGTMAAVWRECLGTRLQLPFRRIPYDQATLTQLEAADDTIGLKYRNITAGTIPAGGSLPLIFEAESPGAQYNVPNNTITVLNTPLNGVTINNPDPGSGTWITSEGSDVETDERLKGLSGSADSAKSLIEEMARQIGLKVIDCERAEKKQRQLAKLKDLIGEEWVAAARKQGLLPETDFVVGVKVDRRAVVRKLS